MNDKRGIGLLVFAAVALAGLIAPLAQAETVGYWRFEEGLDGQTPSGPASITDYSENSQHGDATGTLFYRSEVATATIPLTGQANGLSVEFDSPDDDIYFDQWFPFHGLDDATIEFWLRNRLFGAADLIWSRSDELDANRFNVFANSAAVGMDYRTPTGGLINLVQAAIPWDTWVHIAFTRAGNHYRMYVDGVLQDEHTDTVVDLPTATGWQISGRFSYPFLGLIDEVRLSDTSLSPGQFLFVVPPEQNLTTLVGDVIALNLQQGISNSLDAKLDSALEALEDANANNDGAAVNKLQSFINAVNAQRGKKISEGDADALIAAAQALIDQLAGI